MNIRPVTAVDRVIRSRLRETVAFPHLSERRALRLSAIEHYTARAHFVRWHRILGSPDFTGLTGIFSPLVYVELETTDAPCEPEERLAVTGESYLGRTLDVHGETRHLARHGTYRLAALDGSPVGSARLVNVFTRYDPDPALRRVRELPDETGLGGVPSRIVDLPAVEDLAPLDRRPDFAESDVHAWHYGQTDPNRHVNGIEYLRTMEQYFADMLYGREQDLTRLWAARARVLYRKPCFRGEGYRRVAWFTGEAPLAMCGAFFKADDSPRARPAAVVELTYQLHEEC